MLTPSEMTRKLQSVFEPHQVAVLSEVITAAYENLVKTSDFSELKAIVQELAVAQQNTQKEVQELAVAQQNTQKEVQELAVAQQNTQKEVQKLAVAQQNTEKEVQKLVVAQQNTEKEVQKLVVAQQNTEKDVQKLTFAMGNLRSEVGGLSRSIGYALENDAYRFLPAFLLDRYDIEMTDRLIRTEVDGEEINFFGHATRDGEPALIVGESKQRLDERRRSRREEETVISTLERKAEAVRNAYPGENIVLMLITHYARPAFLRAAEAQGIIVAQSFEW